VRGERVNECIKLCDAASGVGQWLYDWQTLLAGALALVGAYLTVRGIRKQITQSEAHRQDEIMRHHNAARLTLPLALSKVSNLVQQTVNEIAYELEQLGPNGFGNAFDANVEGKAYRPHFEPVHLSDDVFVTFRQFVQSLTESCDIRHVAELVASLQIYLSRYNGFDLKMIGMRTGLEGLMVDAAKIKFLIDKMFNYARFVDDAPFGIVGVGVPDDAWDEIHGKAQGLVFHRESPDFFFPAFKEQVDRYKEQKVSPWNEKFEG
jgi:hypothetical protein